MRGLLPCSPHPTFPVLPGCIWCGLRGLPEAWILLTMGGLRKYHWITGGRGVETRVRPGGVFWERATPTSWATKKRYPMYSRHPSRLFVVQVCGGRGQKGY